MSQPTSTRRESLTEASPAPRDMSYLGLDSFDAGIARCRTSKCGRPSDSLLFLVDRLATQLLGLGAGVEPRRLTALTSTPLPAFRAYLAGREASRTGREEAAAELVSRRIGTGLELRPGGTWLGARDARREWRSQKFDRVRALGSRIRRSSAAPIARCSTSPEFIGRVGRRCSRSGTRRVCLPRLARGREGLGKAYLSYGALAGLDSALQTADDSFRHGWRLDSTTSGDAALDRPGAPVVESCSHG